MCLSLYGLIAIWSNHRACPDLVHNLDHALARNIHLYVYFQSMESPLLRSLVQRPLRMSAWGLAGKPLVQRVPQTAFLQGSETSALQCGGCSRRGEAVLGKIAF